MYSKMFTKLAEAKKIAEENKGFIESFIDDHAETSHIVFYKGTEMFEQKLNEWKQRVIATHEAKSGFADTYKMMLDIDKIIAEAFDHEPMFEENK